STRSYALMKGVFEHALAEAIEQRITAEPPEERCMAQYAHPEALVDTSWVKGSRGDQNVRIGELDYDPTSNYNLGHIPGSGLIDWRKDINDLVRRDIVSKKDRE